MNFLSAMSDERVRLLGLAAREAAALDMALWLVGGTLRDLLLGRVADGDLDLAVEGDALALAQAIAAASGGLVVAAYAPFGTATLAVTGADGRPIQLDLARTRREHYTHPAALPEVQPASLAVDLGRRDFSVNALALALHAGPELPSPGDLYDPFHGRSDLEARRLRLLHSASLRDDPTRMLRGVRLATRLGLSLDAASAAQFKQALATGYLAMLSPERILSELCLALAEPRPDMVLQLADHWGLTAQVVPGLTWQPELAERAARLANAAPAPDQPPPGPLVWAGLLLYGLDEPALAHLAARYPLPAPAQTMLKQIPALRRRAAHLAGQPASVIEQTLRPFSHEAVTLLRYAEPAAAAAASRYQDELRMVRAPLDGNDLRRLGLSPGPMLGQLLNELRRATLDGEITTRAQAEAWVHTRIEPRE